MSYMLLDEENKYLYNQLLEEVRLIEKWKKDAKHPFLLKDWMPKKVKRALKDLDQNHNHSIAVELFLRNIEDIDRVIIKYRGNNITVRELFAKSYAFAKSLKEMGFKKGDTVPVCISNIPEFAVMYLATSFIGAKLNSFGPDFDRDYLVKIMNDSNSKTVFVSDDYYGRIEESVERSNIENVVMFSLEDSLYNGNLFGYYDAVYGHDFSNKIDLYRSKQNGLRIFTQKDFVEMGKTYDGQVLEHVDLDDPFIESYSSGSTAPGRPKGVIHSVRAYMTLSRFKEFDVSGYPPMSNIVSLFVLPTFTHTGPSCVLNDTLYCKNCVVAMEPFYEPKWFPYSVFLNNAGFVPAVNSFWHELCNKLEFDPFWKNLKLRDLAIPTIVGEGTTEGEFRRYDRIAKEHKFGINRFHFPVAFSNGGGNVEGLGGYFTLFTSYLEKIFAPFMRGESIGLTTYKCMDVKVIDGEGKECGVGEIGELYQKTPFDMISYSNPELNDAEFKDGYLSLGAVGYKSDSQGRVKFKGRPKDFLKLDDGSTYYYFQAEDSICSDKENIYKYALVKSVDSDNYVCHIILQPDAKKSEEKVLRECASRAIESVPREILENLYFRVRTLDEYFPYTRDCGKMSRPELSLESVDEKMIYIGDAYNMEQAAKKDVKRQVKKRNN